MIKAFEVLFLIIWAAVGLFYRMHLNGQGIKINEDKSRFLTIMSGPIIWVWSIVWFVISGFMPLFKVFDKWVKIDDTEESGGD